MPIRLRLTVVFWIEINSFIVFSTVSHFNLWRLSSYSPHKDPQLWAALRGHLLCQVSVYNTAVTQNKKSKINPNPNQLQAKNHVMVILHCNCCSIIAAAPAITLIILTFLNMWAVHLGTHLTKVHLSNCSCIDFVLVTNNQYTPPFT